MNSPLSLIKEGDICCEIGVWKGDFSRKILSKKPKELHLVDPWIYQDYPGRMYYIPQIKMDAIYNQVVKTFEQNAEVIIHRVKSTEISFAENYLDWIYIDGDHSYEKVLEDLEMSFHAVKNGGWITGDDYGWNDSNGPKGLAHAVHEFTKEHNLQAEISLSTRQFVIQVRK